MTEPNQEEARPTSVRIDLPPETAYKLKAEAAANMRTLRAECTMVLVNHAEKLAS